MMRSREEPRDPLLKILTCHGACPEAVEWARGYRTMEELFQSCGHAEWMLWSLEQVGYADERKLRRFAVACARRHAHMFGDARCDKAVEVAERFAAGLAGHEALRQALSQARAAGRDATRSADWSTAVAAARSAAAQAVRDRGIDAARGASKDTLRVVAWDTSRDTSVADEEAWQCLELRRLIHDDMPGVIAGVRTRFAGVRRTG